MSQRGRDAGAVLAETACVLAAIALFISAKTFQPYMWAGVGLLAASFAVRWLASRRLATRTPLDAPLLLFLASALVGVWAAYDQPVAWVKFLHILGGIALYYLIASRGAVPWFSAATFLALTLFGLGLALYFITQFDYGAEPGKFALIARLGVWIHNLAPHLPGRLPHANIIGGTLAVILSLSLVAAWGRRAAAWRLLFLLSGCVMMFAIVMTASRGAWLALAAVAGAIAAGAWAARRIAEQWHGFALAAALVAGAIVLGGAALVAGDSLARALGSIPAGDRLLGRAELYGQAWGLIKDYIFTGSGLGMFGMVYSSYVLLIWVHFLGHAHNFFLQVWIEQGVLGFVALLWMVAAFYFAAWRWRKQLTWAGYGGLAAATVMLLHGLVDNPLYSFRVLPLLFVPLAIVVGSRPPAADGRRTTGGRRPLVIGLTVVAVAAGAVLARNQIAALWYANLGSVAQAKLELTGYSFPDHLVDDVRHSTDMSEAQSYFTQALAYDTDNVTARQRLALIDLGQGQHEAAMATIQPAFKRDVSNVNTRELLGEAYLGLGRLDEALALCSSFPGAATRLEGIAWVRYDRYGDKERAAWARTLAQQINQNSNGRK